MWVEEIKKKLQASLTGATDYTTTLGPVSVVPLLECRPSRKAGRQEGFEKFEGPADWICLFLV